MKTGFILADYDQSNSRLKGFSELIRVKRIMHGNLIKMLSQNMPEADKIFNRKLLSKPAL